MPLLVREYLEKHISGNNTPCAIVAVYGNRHFDDCLVEMEDLLTEKGFLVTAAAACLGEHSYTTQIATGRPDEADLAWAKEFGQKLQEKLTGPVQALEKGVIPGNRPIKRENHPHRWHRSIRTVVFTVEIVSETVQLGQSMQKIQVRQIRKSVSSACPVSACVH